MFREDAGVAITHGKGLSSPRAPEAQPLWGDAQQCWSSPETGLNQRRQTLAEQRY